MYVKNEYFHRELIKGIEDTNWVILFIQHRNLNLTNVEKMK